MSTLIIPESVKSIGSYAVTIDCGIKPLIIKGTPTIKTIGLKWCHVCASSAMKQSLLKAGLNEWDFFSLEGDDWQTHLKPLLKGFKCYEPYFEYLGFSNLKFTYMNEELQYSKSEDGYYIVQAENLSSSFYVTITFNDPQGQEHSVKVSVPKVEPEFTVSYTATQSTITVNDIKAKADETFIPEVYEIELLAEYKPGEYYTEKRYNTLPIILENLYPGQVVGLRPKVQVGNIIYSDIKYVYTSSLGQSINCDTLTASSLALSCNYKEGDANITEEKVIVNGKTYEGGEVLATGLDPKTTYTVTYSVMANGHEVTVTENFTTAPLSLVTKDPKVISEGNVIIAAESNICDEETNVGFEWRRTDWSDDFSSNTGIAYMYNGQMEGYIRNMKAEKLWKCRPFYLSDSGQYYYGDWVGVDPSNTSYFEATVHTYSSIKVEGNTALVKGYALRGTDAIKVQGFVYWKRVSDAKANTGRKYVMSVPDNALTIESSGQIMSATLKDLDYSSEYCYMAFVTTTEGETFYGEEQTFSTGPDITGINTLYSNDTDSLLSVEVVGYFDLNGRQIIAPKHGFYIVRFSDGTSSKVLMK